MERRGFLRALCATVLTPTAALLARISPVYPAAPINVQDAVTKSCPDNSYKWQGGNLYSGPIPDIAQVGDIWLNPETYRVYCYNGDNWLGID
jgi:hypothetical protein